MYISDHSQRLQPGTYSGGPSGAYVYAHAILQSAVNVKTTKMRLGKSLTRVSSTALSLREMLHNNRRGSRFRVMTFTRVLPRALDC